MLFRKKIDPSCVYCIHGARMEDHSILCSKRGLKTEDDSCAGFATTPASGFPSRQRQ